jgi:NAD(P)H-dependent FMN reductase
MPEAPLRVLAVVGSLHSASVTRTVVNHVAARLAADGCAVDVLDLDKEPLPLYDPDTAEDQPGGPRRRACPGHA